LDNQIKHLKRKKEQNSLLDEKDNKDIKATIMQEYDSMRELMGTGKDNLYLPELESRNSESLALLSVLLSLARLSKFAWRGYGKDWSNVTSKTPPPSKPS
jgi:hypothetical protein